MVMQVSLGSPSLVTKFMIHWVNLLDIQLFRNKVSTYIVEWPPLNWEVDIYDYNWEHMRDLNHLNHDTSTILGPKPSSFQTVNNYKE